MSVVFNKPEIIFLGSAGVSFTGITNTFVK